MDKDSGGVYKVTVQPNTDLAFIVIFIIILDKIGHVDELTSLTFRAARMMVDPFDISGLVLDAVAETIVETIVESTVENAIENNVTN